MTPEVYLSASVRRTIIVGEIKMGDTKIESSAKNPLLTFDRNVVAEVLPESERNGREQEAAAPDTSVRHLLITRVNCCVAHLFPPLAVVGCGVRAHALAGLQRIKNCDLVRVEREIEQGKVLDHALLADCSRDDDAAVFEVPAQGDLRHGLVVLRCDRIYLWGADQRAASYRAPRFDAD